MAIYTSVTGLSAATADLAVTANNIANVQSNGFKKSRVQFGDLIGASALSDPRRSVGIGTVNRGNTQQHTQGSMAQTGNTLDLAITGNGFFLTQTVRGEQAYTRNGAFALDRDRYVVDGTGARLQVFPTNAEGVVQATNRTQPLLIPETSGIPQATSEVDVSVNLPSSGAIPAAAFNPADPTSYNSSTSTTIYDAQGNPLAYTVYYRRLTAPTVGVPTSTWEARAFVGNAELDTDGAAAGVQPVVLTFDINGTLTAPAGPVAYQPFTPPTGAAALTISTDHSAGTTQLADPFNAVALKQDGFAAGRLDSLSIDQAGLVLAGYSNGDTQALGKVALVGFSNPAALKQLGDARWTATGGAGAPLVGEAGGQGLGTILSGTIERSNVELTDELVNLIIAQRNFQGNAKAIETDQAMTNSIINLR